MSENLVTYREAAELLGIAPSTLRVWTSQKRVPFYKLNNKATRYSPSELKTWLESQHVAPVGGSR